MSKARRWVIIVLSLAVLVMIGINMAEKDDTAQVRCAMFRNSNRRVTFRPQHGQQVLVRANITLYEPRGDYQIIVESMQPAGEGLLQQKYEQLKAKLSEEGLFDQQFKKPLPSPAHCVGVITSKTGAALHDILHVLKRRDPSLPVIIYPTAVQGDDAPGQIVRAIALANARQECDVLIVGRGGGSLEDLWSFNDERVARAIYDSDIPVISAVGHEPDVAISDFVADRRASTPSNAAEIAVPDMAELLRTLDAARSRMTQSIRRDIAAHSRRLESLSKKRVLTDPTAYLADRRQDVDHMTHRLCAAMRVVTDVQNRRFGALAASLDALSPLKVLGRGYALAQQPDGTVLRSADQARIGETLRLRLADGALRCQVKEKENEHGSKKDV